VVACYFRLLGVVRILLNGAIPSAAPWIGAARGGCAYAPAVVLGRRMSDSRMMMAQQASH
jgi:hypothetical protein